MPDDPRGKLLTLLADAVTALCVGHPTRVAIDGRSAAGKTMLADDLAAAVRARDRAVLRASIDDFHRPGHKHRSRRSEWTPRSYYDEGFDYDAFRHVLLRPLGPGGSRRCRTGLFDAFHDVWLAEEWQDVADRTVAIIDGVFLLRPDLAAHWDYIIWLDIDLETMVERACKRDVAWVGSAAIVEEQYRRHWMPTHELYERLVAPQQFAHAVIDNRLPQRPTVLRLASP